MEENIPQPRLRESSALQGPTCWACPPGPTFDSISLERDPQAGPEGAGGLRLESKTGTSVTRRPVPEGSGWEQGDLNPHMRVSPRAPVIRHWGAARPSADLIPR